MRYKAAIKIDLPSKGTHAATSTLAKVFRLKGSPTGREQTLLDTFTVLDRLLEGFRLQGITNVISLRVDNAEIYRDNAMVDDDLEGVVTAIDARREEFERDFRVIHLVTEHRADGLHYVFDVSVAGQVRQGDEEVYILVGAKPDEFSPRLGETATAFRQRLLLSLANGKPIQGYQAHVESFLTGLAHRLGRHLRTEGASLQYVEAGVMAPAAGLRDLRKTTFSRHRRTFRTKAPNRATPDYHQDPWTYHYADPQGAYADLLLLGPMINALPDDTIVYTPEFGSVGTVDSLGPSARARIEAYQSLGGEDVAMALDGQGDLPCGDEALALSHALRSTAAPEPWQRQATLREMVEAELQNPGTDHEEPVEPPTQAAPTPKPPPQPTSPQAPPTPRPGNDLAGWTVVANPKRP